MNFIIYPQKKKKKKIRIEKERRDCHRGISLITRNTVRYQRTRSRLMGSLQPVAAGERTNRDFERRKQLVLVSLTRNSCEGTRRVRYELTNHARWSDLEKKKKKTLLERQKEEITKERKKKRNQCSAVVGIPFLSRSCRFVSLTDLGKRANCLFDLIGTRKFHERCQSEAEFISNGLMNSKCAITVERKRKMNRILVEFRPISSGASSMVDLFDFKNIGQ